MPLWPAAQTIQYYPAALPIRTARPGRAASPSPRSERPFPSGSRTLRLSHPTSRAGTHQGRSASAVPPAPCRRPSQGQKASHRSTAYSKVPPHRARLSTVPTQWHRASIAQRSLIVTLTGGRFSASSCQRARISPKETLPALYARSGTACASAAPRPGVAKMGYFTDGVAPCYGCGNDQPDAPGLCVCRCRLGATCQLRLQDGASSETT